MTSGACHRYARRIGLRGMSWGSGEGPRGFVVGGWCERHRWVSSTSIYHRARAAVTSRAGEGCPVQEGQTVGKCVGGSQAMKKDGAEEIASWR